MYNECFKKSRNQLKEIKFRKIKVKKYNKLLESCLYKKDILEEQLLKLKNKFKEQDLNKKINIPKLKIKYNNTVFYCRHLEKKIKRINKLNFV